MDDIFLIMYPLSEHFWDTQSKKIVYVLIKKIFTNPSWLIFR